MSNRSLIPFVFGDFPVLEETFSELSPFTGKGSDITISEDEKNIYVEAAVPGLRPEDIEVTYDRAKGLISIKGSREEREEDRKRRFYRRASRTFSYRVSVPGEIDEKEPLEADCEHGVVKVRLAKLKEALPTKIPVKKK